MNVFDNSKIGCYSNIQFHKDDGPDDFMARKKIIVQRAKIMSDISH